MVVFGHLTVCSGHQVAEFHPQLYLSEKGIILDKGTHPEF